MLSKTRRPILELLHTPYNWNPMFFISFIPPHVVDEDVVHNVANTQARAAVRGDNRPGPAGTQLPSVVSHRKVVSHRTPVR